jgi:protein arginine N-methyltransferase 7
MPAVASHNTVRMRFDVESTDYLHLHKPDAAFPPNQFAMLADEARCQVRGRRGRRGRRRGVAPSRRPPQATL